MPPTRREFLLTATAALFGLVVSPTTLDAAEAVHVVRRGETLSTIAARYGVTVAQLQTRNRLQGATIHVGQRLFVPRSGSLPPDDAPVAALAPVIAATRRINVDRGRWKHVVVHHSGIEAGNAEAYDAGHRRRGMEYGLAYHFVIGNGRDSGDGEIEVGPRWRRQIHGGHVRNDAFNDQGIGICLVGNFEKRRPGARQLASLTALVDWLRTDAPLGVRPRFTVHRWVDRNHTVCPGRFFPYDTFKRRYG